MNSSRNPAAKNGPSTGAQPNVAARSRIVLNTMRVPARRIATQMSAVGPVPMENAATTTAR